MVTYLLIINANHARFLGAAFVPLSVFVNSAKIQEQIHPSMVIYVNAKTPILWAAPDSAFMSRSQRWTKVQNQVCTKLSPESTRSALGAARNANHLISALSASTAITSTAHSAKNATPLA